MRNRETIYLTSMRSRIDPLHVNRCEGDASMCGCMRRSGPGPFLRHPQGVRVCGYSGLSVEWQVLDWGGLGWLSGWWEPCSIMPVPGSNPASGWICGLLSLVVPVLEPFTAGLHRSSFAVALGQGGSWLPSGLLTPWPVLSLGSTCVT